MDHRPNCQLALGRHLIEDGRLAPWQLFYAITALSKWDTCLADVLISKGWMTEEALLPYLAHHYHAPLENLEQAPPDFRLLSLLDPNFCVKYAIVPWITEDDQIVYATSRPQHFEKIEYLLPGGKNGKRIVLVKECDLLDVITRVFKSSLVEHCEARVAPDESCRQWAGASKSGSQSMILCLLALVIFIWNFPLTGLVAIGVLILTTQILATCMKIAAFVHCHKAAPPAHNEASSHILGGEPLPKQPKISVLVPLFNETEIAQALLRRLSALTYPKALLDVILVLEEKDKQTKEILAHSNLPQWMRVVEVPEGSGLTTKPRAMNYALDFCKGDIIGIWDAEDAPAPDQLEQVADHFAHATPDVACLQGILDYYNPKTNWLSRCFTLEYSMWFRTIIRGMSRLGAAVPLGGTTLFLKRDAIEAIGGWDAHNVTEDADLGIRLYRYGYRTDLISTVTQEEANCRLRPWIKQRSRWLKGYMVTYLVHMRRPKKLFIELGLRRFLGFNAIFLSTLSQFLLAPLIWSFWLLTFGAQMQWIAPVPSPIIYAVSILFFCIMLLDMTLAALSLRGQNRRWLMGWALTLPFYFTLATLGAYKALYELFVSPFYWDKTAHGQTQEGLSAEYSAFGT